MGNLSSFPNRRDWGMGYVVNESGDFGIPESNYDNLDTLKEGMRAAFNESKKKDKAEDDVAATSDALEAGSSRVVTLEDLRNQITALRYSE